MKRLLRLAFPIALAVGLTIIALVGATMSTQHAHAGTMAASEQSALNRADNHGAVLSPSSVREIPVSTGVSLEPPSSWLTAERGTEITHSHVLRNLGALTDTFDLDRDSTTGWSSLLPTSPITLSPSATATVQLVVSVPMTAEVGTVDLSTITATSRLDPAVQATAIAATTVMDDGTPWTDLEIGTWADPDEIAPGDRTTFSLVIANAGPLTTAVPVTLSDRLIPSRAIGSWLLPPGCSGDVELGEMTCTPVIPAGSGVITLSLLITTSDVFTGLAVNLAAVSSEFIDPNPFNDTAQASVFVNPDYAQARTYLPLVFRQIVPVLGPPLPPPTHVSGTPPLDFDAIRADLEARGKELAFVKIGFHAGLELTTALTASLQELDAAGVPFFLKTVDNAEPVYIAQQLMQTSGLSHTLVYRRSGYDTPNYDLPPEQAAQAHWQIHTSTFPPELDPSLVWLETMNEVDKNRSEWLAQVALETAQLALDDDEGWRWAAFGWASGEPEADHWEGPYMLQFLQLAADHPDRLAIALHEYSYDLSDIGNCYPHLVGRVQALYQACDAYNIGRPTVLITEWGWQAYSIPPTADAISDLAWASWFYAAYPEIKGAAIWFLGPGFDPIDDQVEQLIRPWRDYALSNYYVVEPGQGQIDPELFRPDGSGCTIPSMAP